MENESQTLEQLMAEKAEVARKIAELDAKGVHGEELDNLHKRHEELTQMIEETPIADDLDKAA